MPSGTNGRTSGYQSPSLSISPGSSRPARPRVAQPTPAAPTPPPTLLLPANTTDNRPWLNGWTKSPDQTRIEGYQTWAVQELVTDREAVLPCICVFTGDKADSIPLDRFHLLVPPQTEDDPLTISQQNHWNLTRAILKSSGARLSQTSEGWLPVTSLANLSATRSPVQIPNGDYAVAQPQLYLNINLRRLGLGARASLRVAPPPSAQLLHFRQTFKLPSARVVGLIKLVQHALALFGLGPVSEDAPVRLSEGDGLLCDLTISGLATLSDGPASHSSPLPTALLTLLLSLPLMSRAYLHALSFAPPKDPFGHRTAFLIALRSFTRSSRSVLSHEVFENLVITYRNREARSLRHHRLARGMELPLSDFEKFVEAVHSGGLGGGASVKRLWKKDEEEHDGDEEGGTTDAGDRGEVVRGVLRGVKRAGKKLGDSVRGTDAEREERGNIRENLKENLREAKQKLGPSLLISEPSGSSAPGSSRPSLDIPNAGQNDIFHKTSSFASRIGLGLPMSSDREVSSTPAASVPPSATASPRSLYDSLGPPPVSRRSSGSRRAVSEQQSVSAANSPTMGGNSTLDEEWEEGTSEERPTGRPTVKGLRRRHSFNIPQDAPEPFQILSRKRLETDVNLRMTAFSLRRRERKLADMVEALQIVHASLDEALASLEPPVIAAQARLTSIQSSALALAPSHMPSSSARLVYAQSVVEDKLADIQSFCSACIAKIGRGTGDVAMGVVRLGKERSGMRKLVLTLLLWKEWSEARWRGNWFRAQPSGDVLKAD